MPEAPILGSTIVSVPPDIAKLETEIFNILVPDATLVVVEPVFPSILKFPFDIEKEPAAIVTFPFTFKVPPDTVKVPLLDKVLRNPPEGPILAVPEETANVPPEETVKFTKRPHLFRMKINIFTTTKKLFEFKQKKVNFI